MFFNRDVSARAEGRQQQRDDRGTARRGRLGQRRRMQIDFATRRAHRRRRRRRCGRSRPTADFFSPDCDSRAVPVPAGGNVEGEHRLRVHRRRRLPPDRRRRRTPRSCTRCGARTSRRHVQRRLPRGVGRRARRTPTRCAAISARAPTPRASRSRRCCSPPTRSRPVTSITRSASSCRTTASQARLRPPGDARHRRRPAARTRPAYGVHLRLRADYPIDIAADRGRAGRRARDAEVRHVSRRRRQHRADRAERPPHHREVGRPARRARSRRRCRSRTSRSSTTARCPADERLRPRALSRVCVSVLPAQYRVDHFRARPATRAGGEFAARDPRAGRHGAATEEPATGDDDSGDDDVDAAVDQPPAAAAASAQAQ